jgi:hypothetical protein
MHLLHDSSWNAEFPKVQKKISDVFGILNPFLQVMLHSLILGMMLARKKDCYFFTWGS